MKLLSRWIGREETAEDVVTASLVDRYRATLDLPAVKCQSGDVAPRLIHLFLALGAAGTMELGEDGHSARGGFLPPVPFPRRMWAGSAIEFSGEIRVGDHVQRHSRVADLSLKQGQDGDLCFVLVDHCWTVNGGLVVNERQTIVYRRRATVPPVNQVISQPTYSEAAIVRAIHPSAALLFRFSALTFNAHRIHYDLPYARDVEGYPDLIVHGPLQATLLMELAMSERGGVPPRTFSFRSSRPLFANQELRVCAGQHSGGRLSLWTCGPDGQVATTAQAAW